MPTNLKHDSSKPKPEERMSLTSTGGNWLEAFISWKMGHDIKSKMQKLKVYQGISKEE